MDENSWKPAYKEVNEIRDWVEHLLEVAEKKYEDISKLLTGLASGILSLSISILDKFQMGRITYTNKVILCVSWIAFIISILLGLFALWRIYTLYKKSSNNINTIVKVGEEELSIDASSYNRLTFSGALEKAATDIIQKESNTNEWPVIGQFITFGIGVFLLFIAGVLNLFRGN